jgi:hypothetical protein
MAAGYHPDGGRGRGDREGGMSTAPTTLPPGPYRFEPGESADTYLIFAAGDDKPMVEMIYVGGEEDFASTARALALLFTAAHRLRSALRASSDRLLALIEEGRDLEEDMEAYQEACEALDAAASCEPSPNSREALLVAALRAVLPYAEAELASLQEAQKRDGGLEAEVTACDAKIEQASQLLSQIEAGRAA